MIDAEVFGDLENDAADGAIDAGLVADMGPIPPGTACDVCGDTESPGYIAWPVDGTMGPLLCNACEALRLFVSPSPPGSIRWTTRTT